MEGMTWQSFYRFFRIRFSNYVDNLDSLRSPRCHSGERPRCHSGQTSSVIPDELPHCHFSRCRSSDFVDDERTSFPVISFAVAQATSSMTSEAEGRVEKSILFQKIRLIFSPESALQPPQTTISHIIRVQLFYADNPSELCPS